MERADRELRRAALQGRALLVLPAIIFSAWHVEAGDSFLVVERVEHLKVYNKYQQEATPPEREQALAPFLPMRILKGDDLLGDGFTRCARVDVGAEMFYLLKDGEGKLSRSGPLGLERTFVNAIPLSDTVEILPRADVQFSPITSPSHQAVRPREKFLRFFRLQNAVYCRRLPDSTNYGWIDLTGKNEQRVWKRIIHNTSSQELISPDVIRAVNAKVDEVNLVLAGLFEHFNSRTRQRKDPPAWTIESTAGRIACKLQGSIDPEDLHGSTLYLIKDLENIAMGARLHIAYTSGSIEIKPK